MVEQVSLSTLSSSLSPSSVTEEYDHECPEECLPSFLKQAQLHEWFEYHYWDGYEDGRHVYKWILVQLVGKKLVKCYRRWEFGFQSKNFILNPQSVYCPQENHLLAPLGTHISVEEITRQRKERVENTLLCLKTMVRRVPVKDEGRKDNEEDNTVDLDLKKFYQDQVLPYVVTTVWWYEKIMNKESPWDTWRGRTIAHAVTCNGYLRMKKQNNNSNSNSK